MQFSTSLTQTSLYVAATMYVAAISFSNDNLIVFISGALAAIWLSINYGIVLVSNSGTSVAAEFGLPTWLMIAFGVVQGFKCYDNHLTQGQPFVYFEKPS